MNERLPIAIYGSDETYIEVGGFKIPCYVLDNGTRVLSQSGMLKALGLSRGTGGGKGGDRLESFANGIRLKEFIPNEIADGIKKPVKFKRLGHSEAFGYEATILQQLVRGVSKAFLQGKLQKQQENIGRNAEILDDGFSKVGLIALIDEATGYQKDINRAKDELRQLLAKFIKEAEGKWVKTFPDEFFEAIFLMKQWTWVGISKSKKPAVIGHYINDIIYSRLAPDVLGELRRKNPVVPETGKRKSKHHQWLTEDIGHPKLQEHFVGVLALARASGYNWNIFNRMMNKSYPRYGKTLEILFPDDNVFEVPQPKTGFDTLLKGLLSVPPPKKNK